MDFVRLDHDSFMSIEGDSIDYAVMEKTAKAVVVPLDAGWNDIGSWSALSEVSEQDEQANVVSGDVLIEDSQNCYVRAENRLVAAVGVHDQVIVETADAVLVASRDKAQDVKRIVERLKLEDRLEHLHHRRVFRPWGSYESIDEGERFLVKRIIVNPGASLSLQMHEQRAEHWVVVTGTAKVTRGDEVMELHEDESTYIPLGMKHRLENTTEIPLEIIEVQTGGYLGEDDIVRFDDVYGR
jgi:mannose-1-phosphate guanylyltransferase/mannose-6-phosphate isomerase